MQIKFLSNVAFCLFTRVYLAFQLGILYRPQNLAENWARNVPHPAQVVPIQKTLWTDLVRWRVLQQAAHKLVSIQAPVAGKAVQAVQLQMLYEPRKPNKALQGRGPHLFDVL